MFAVIEIGGNQHKVSENDKIEVNRLEQKVGETFKIDSVLLFGDSETSAKIGKPYVEGASVDAKVIDHFKGEKIIVSKFVAKKRQHKTYGHRQPLTMIEITSIKG